MTIRSMTETDLDAVRAVNDLSTDDVGPLDADLLSTLLTDGVMALVAVEPEGAIVGFAIVVDQTCGRLTPRAAWALETAGADAHLERVAFDMAYSGYGLGPALYGELDARLGAAAAASPSGAVTLSSMVRLDPPNEHAIRFHESRGFEIVDRAAFDGITVGVATKTYSP